ncbi:MAG: hypothetical protein ACXU82_07100 [Caulobacteraceae bacterium]
MAFDLTDRLPTMDRDQLLALRINAQRLQSSEGVKADQAGALLPLIEAEIARRGPKTIAKPGRPKTAVAAKAPAEKKPAAARKPAAAKKAAAAKEL